MELELNYCYMRVSTEAQNFEHQEKQIRAYLKDKKFKNPKWVKEKVSSGKDERLIFELIENLKEGDRLLVFEISRIARSISQMFSIVESIKKAGAELHIVNNNMVLDDSIVSQTLLFAFSLTSQLEKELIQQRVKSGISASREKNNGQWGRPVGSKRGSKLHQNYDEIRNLQKKGVSMSSISKILDCSRHTLYKYLDSEQYKNKLKQEK
jgi:DNA invertase Pin-like site-specific DNA recombinase